MSNATPSLVPPNNRWSDGWLRFFPFESRSWRKTIAQSNLSAEAKAIVESVVRQSRLMRFEKLEVVNELIAHFSDGKLAGQSYPQLVADFGDPVVTAKLIRRSKIRNRPTMFKMLHIFGWVLVGLASVYAVFMTYFHLGQPQPSVDYLAEFNDEIEQLDDSDLAWPIYRPLWIKHGFSEGGGFAYEQMFVRQETEDGAIWYGKLKRPTDEGWDVAVNRLNEISDLLDGFREARFKPRLGVQLHADRNKYQPEDFEALFPGHDPDHPPFNTETVDEEVAELMKDAAIHILLPHIQVMRNAARIFIVDTRAAIEQNDPQRVATNIETMLGVGRHAADSNTLVGSLVGFAVGGLCFDLIEEVITEHPEFLDDEQLARIQTALEKEDISQWLKIEGERVFLMDTIQRVYTDDGQGDGRITSTGLQVINQLNAMYDHSIAFQEDERAVKLAVYVAEPASLFVVASRKETTELANRILDQYETQFRQNYWEKEEGEMDVETFLAQNRMRHVILSQTLPAFTQVYDAMVRTIARQEGLIVAVASQRHFLKHGTWPNSFAQLSPEFLIEFPLDQMNGEFLKIKAENDGVVVYSVGHDLDDDGGTMHRDNPTTSGHRRARPMPPHVWVGGASNARDFDADWILWPQADWESRLPAEEE